MTGVTDRDHLQGAIGKRLALATLQATGGFRLARYFSRRGILVLTYHHVVPSGARESRPANTVYAEEFSRHLHYLVSHHHVMTGEEFRSVLLEARSPRPNSVLITFDDGYRNNYAHAFRLLREHGATATFFLTTGFVGRSDGSLWFERFDASMALLRSADAGPSLRRAGVPADHTSDVSRARQWLKYSPSSIREAVIDALEKAAPHSAPSPLSQPLTWSEAREMATAGMTIGAHTDTHQILSAASSSEVQHELAISKSRIEREIGAPCWCFSYPNGTAADFRPADEQAVAAAGYSCAFTQIDGRVMPDANPFALPRVSVPDSGDFKVFLSRATGLYSTFRRVARRTVPQ